jgi:hypothetical protein
MDSIHEANCEYIPHGARVRGAGGIILAKKCARTFSIVVEKGKKSILDVSHLLPDALPRSVRSQYLIVK